MKAYLKLEMPTNCAHCMIWSICPALPYGEWPDYESILTNDVIGDGGIRHPDCPLVPVPPHGRPVARGKWSRIDYEPLGHDYKCSACGWKNDMRTHFCPNCGAMMEES